MRTLLHGSYFGLNFGDTLLCRLFADWLRLAGATQIALPLADARNRRLIGASGRGLHHVPGASGMVLCGGGYFSERRAFDRKWTARAYLRHMLLAKWVGPRMPYAILGVGVGPISSPKLRGDIAALFEAASRVVVRDEESAQSLYDWGVRRDVSVGVDAVVTASDLELLANAQGGMSLDNARQKHGAVIAVHVSAHPSAGELATARAALDWVLNNTDAAIVLANDSVPRRAGSEWSVALEVPPEHEDRIIRHQYSGEPGNLIAILAQADLVITSKLHVGIVRASLNKPVISVPSHTKTPRFYRQMGLQDWCIQRDEGREQPQIYALLREWGEGRRPDWQHFEHNRMPGSYLAEVKDFVSTLRSDD